MKHLTVQMVAAEKLAACNQVLKISNHDFVDEIYPKKFFRIFLM